MSGTERGQAGPGSKARLVSGVLASVLALDLLSKGWIRGRLELGESSPLLGDWLRLTYLLNPGAAFGVDVGAWSRPAFAFLALVSVGVILALVRRTPSAERLHLTAFALVMGGALGNLVDRLRPHGAVVDFLDVGLGAFRWPVFNVADVGVTAGVLLLLVSWRAGGAEARSVPARSASGESRSPDPP